MRIDEKVGVASEVENGGFATLRLREALTRKRPVKLSFIPFSNVGERSEREKIVERADHDSVCAHNKGSHQEAIQRKRNWRKKGPSGQSCLGVRQVSNLV
jgi:hypothetical protein